jgi:uncharacterized protein YggE
MRITVTLAAATIAIALTRLPSLGDPTPPPSITVSGQGSVAYSPDIARVSLGVRAEALTAAAAAASVNARANDVVSAMRKLGIADSDIKTSGYDISYQPPRQTAGMMQPAPVPPAFTSSGHVQTQSIARKTLPPAGTFVATETIMIKSGIGKAGMVLDSGVSAGADETFGLSFDTSMRDSLYRQALAAAVADARAQADILAQAAGVTIVGIQSISPEGAMPAPSPMMGVRMMAMAAAPPPVMGGTDSIDATVDVVYLIK